MGVKLGLLFFPLFFLRCENMTAWPFVASFFLQGFSWGLRMAPFPFFLLFRAETVRGSLCCGVDFSDMGFFFSLSSGVERRGGLPFPPDRGRVTMRLPSSGLGLNSELKFCLHWVLLSEEKCVFSVTGA